MKWTHATGLVSTLALMAAGGVWAGCSGDDTRDGGSDAASDVTTAHDSGGNDAAGNDAGGNDAGGDAAALDCTTYCSTIQQVCNGTTNQQYIDNATCMSMCTGIPNDAGAGATSGDSLACRMYHLGLAAQSSSNADVHCPHAGPYGYGACGDLCDDFCQQYFASAGPCSGSTKGYANADACRAYCSGAAGADASAGAPGQGAASPAVLCREYHLENAYKTGGSGGGHCAHAGADGGGVCP